MKKGEQAKGIKLEIRLRVPKELEEGHYSNYATVGHSPHEFHIFFGQISTHREPSPEKIAYADAVAHIILTPGLVPDVLKALSDNYEKYKKRDLSEHVKPKKQR